MHKWDRQYWLDRAERHETKAKRYIAKAVHALKEAETSRSIVETNERIDAVASDLVRKAAQLEQMAQIERDLLARAKEQI